MQIHCSTCNQQISVSSEGLLPKLAEEDLNYAEVLLSESALPFDIYDLEEHLISALPEWSFSIEEGDKTSLIIKCPDCLDLTFTNANTPLQGCAGKKKKKAKKILKKIKKLIEKLFLLLN